MVLRSLGCKLGRNTVGFTCTSVCLTDWDNLTKTQARTLSAETKKHNQEDNWLRLADLTGRVAVTDLLLLARSEANTQRERRDAYKKLTLVKLPFGKTITMSHKDNLRRWPPMTHRNNSQQANGTRREAYTRNMLDNASFGLT